MKETPPAFDRLLGDLDVGQVPHDGLLRAGHAAERRRQRWAVAGAVAIATALVIGMNTDGNALRSPDPEAPGALQPTEQSSTSSTPRASTPVDLPTNTWKPGDPASLANISGTLALDEDGCVSLQRARSKTRIYATWPAGYSAEKGRDGRASLRDPEHVVVAHEGDALSMGGGYGPSSQKPHPCLPADTRTVAYIQSSVTHTVLAN